MAERQDNCSLDRDSSYDLDFDDTFLENLPPSIKRHTYHTEQQVFDIVQSEFAHFEVSLINSSEFILFLQARKLSKYFSIPPNEDTPISNFARHLILMKSFF